MESSDDQRMMVSEGRSRCLFDSFQDNESIFHSNTGYGLRSCVRGCVYMIHPRDLGTDLMMIDGKVES